MLEREARRVGAPLIVAGEDFHMREENGRLVFEDESGLLDLPLPRLAGRTSIRTRPPRSRRCARSAPDLDTTPSRRPVARRVAGAAATPAARARRRSRAPGAEIWLDGGHNEDGARVLAEAMAEFEERTPRPLVLICGAQTTKDVRAFLRHFRGLARRVIAAPVEGEHKSWAPEDVASAAREEGMEAEAADECGGGAGARSRHRLRPAAPHPRRRIALSSGERAGGERVAGRVGDVYR